MVSLVVMLDCLIFINLGKFVFGDVLQQLLSILGNVINLQNNSNGGGVVSLLFEVGDGVLCVLLCGLGINCMLVLVDGQCMFNLDINLILLDMIEWVDVLVEGVLMVYGLDAIGGVVNFILCKNYKGVQFSFNDGIFSYGDVKCYGFNFIVGIIGDGYSIVVGLDYNKYDEILVVWCKFFCQQLYLFSGVVVVVGFSLILIGCIQVLVLVVVQYGCVVNLFGIVQVILVLGDGLVLGDYCCCFVFDIYNYVVFNYIQIVQKCINGFVLGSFNIIDNVIVFVDVFYNYMVFSGQDVFLLVGIGDGLIIFVSNLINLFGIIFSQNLVNGDLNSGYNFQICLIGVGMCVYSYIINIGQVNVGLCGNFGESSSWIWDVLVNYSYIKCDQCDINEVDIFVLQVVVDGGVNIFNQVDLSVGLLLSVGVKILIYVFIQLIKQVQVDVSGDLWDLLVGMMQLLVGVLYCKQFMNYIVSDFVVFDLVIIICQILQEVCGLFGCGSFNVKEVFVEMLILLLVDKLWVCLLNIDLGVCSFNYSIMGIIINGKVVIEW